MNDLTLSIMESNDPTLIEAFNMDVLVSTDMTDDEKLVLLEFSSGMSSLMSFINNGGIEDIRENLKETLIDSGYEEAARTLGCSVNTRDVMLGAVVGFGIGVSTGFYGGLTAGSFTVPILGTAAGAVGGAVFGGAFGFASGAFSSVVSGLLGTCFRDYEPTMTGVKDASCNKLWEYYHNGWTSNPPVDCYPSFTF